MKRANLYALIAITTIFFLFCLAAVYANAQEADNDESLVTRLANSSTGCLPGSTSFTKV